MSVIHAARTPEVTQREIDHMAFSRALAGECVVLMENDGALPLLSVGKLALYGSGACQTIKGGTGSGEVNSRNSVSIAEGLEKAGFQITTKAWLNRQEAKYAEERQKYLNWLYDYSKQKNVSEQTVAFSYPFPVIAPVEIRCDDIAISDTNTAVYVISRISGEGYDRQNRRGDYQLYEEERDQLAQLGKAYERVIVVLNIGGVIDMSEMKEISGINAVLLLSQLGNVGGDVLGDILTGKVNPSGKLTDTWARRYTDYPSSATFGKNDGNVDDEYYTEGIYVGYRYFDTFQMDPLYPFGYGKSYTSFEIRVQNVKVERDTVRLFVTVDNQGAVPGKEVVQLYCSAPDGTLAKPYQELLCFAKTKLLMPDEREQLELIFSVRDMASYCEACGVWVLEAGEYILRVGSSSRDTQPAAVLVLDQLVKTEVLKNLFADTDPVNEIKAPVKQYISPEKSVPRISLCADEIPTRYAVYQGTRKPYFTDKTEVLTVKHVKQGLCTVEELVSQLTLEELAALCVGTLRVEGKAVVGNASFMVPGAAGDTSAIAEETRGIKGLIMADGPAGLRLQPVFKTDKKGNLLPGGSILGDVATPFDSQYTDTNSDTYYQYCTSIPVGWALAQSWNMPLLEETGSMIGAEMELFGIDLWLAPALNIHRNPLCGRNFEYYSEDPVVSGKAAAAITKGVQRHRGKGTTIKHFAANSQEENRYFTNSHISERAIREIYLAGFEIAVKESQPVSIMTSYNLLNGVHTANSYDLIQAVARDEWGFQGVVMSDWFTSQEQPALITEVNTIYPISASTGCIYAGNDIQMPGCQKNVDDIVEAVRRQEDIDGYPIMLADLQQSAANVVRAVIAATI